MLKLIFYKPTIGGIRILSIWCMLIIIKETILTKIDINSVTTLWWIIHSYAAVIHHWLVGETFHIQLVASDWHSRGWEQVGFFALIIHLVWVNWSHYRLIKLISQYSSSYNKYDKLLRKQHWLSCSFWRSSEEKQTFFHSCFWKEDHRGSENQLYIAVSVQWTSDQSSEV